MISLKDMPKDYRMCPATDQACPRAAHCLRALAWRAMSQGADLGLPYVYSILPRLADHPTDACPEYRDATPVRIAWGMSHLVDDVPHRLVLTVKKQIIRCFGNERYYYFCRKGERAITPQVQKAIAQVFRRNGLNPEVNFDKYEDGYNW